MQAITLEDYFDLACLTFQLAFAQHSLKRMKGASIHVTGKILFHYNRGCYAHIRLTMVPLQLLL